MNANFSKRFTAYIIDLIIIMVVSSIISFVIPKNNNYNNLNEKLTKVTQEYTNKLVSEDGSEIHVNEYNNYFNEAAPIEYEMEKESFIEKLIIIIIGILYYVVFQFKYAGQTLGKKLMKIKVVKDSGELQINDLLFRSFIINTLLGDLLCIVLLFTTKNLTYLYANSAVNLIFGLIVIISGITCIIRKDNRSLHDIITKTKVIEVK